MKEEIETQRRVTRQAQRQFHALQHTLAEKFKETELVRRHLSAFEVQTAMMTSGGPASSTSPSKSSCNSCNAVAMPTSSSAVAVLVAGAQSGGSGARHRESIAAAASLIESPVAVAAITKRLKDQVQRQELYKKKLKQLLERLCRHVQFLQANLETLRHKQASTARELQFFLAKLLQERNHCTELERKWHELLETQATHAHNAMLVLDSLREEIASRSMMSQHRYEADRRREQLLQLVQSSPAKRSGLARTTSTDRSGGVPASASSASRKNSLRVLSADKSSNDFAPSFFSGDLGASRKSPGAGAMLAAPSASGPRHRSNSVDLQQFVHREAFMQIYEGQYARVLEETRESDLSVVIERFVGFKETKRQLLQIESDVAAQNVQLEREREAHNDLVRKLRVSGIAEVEKRKKIRDFLEQMHHVKAQVKGQAKDKFLEQFKTFSYVQQGIGNIVELFKCLDDKIQAPPPSACTLVSPLASGSSPVAVARGLGEIARFCVQVVRGNPGGAPIVFTADRVDKLRVFVSDHLKPHFRSKRRSRLMAAIESSLGSLKAPSPTKGATAAAESVVSSLLKARRRRSSTEDALTRKLSLSNAPAIKSGVHANKALASALAAKATRKSSVTQQSSCAQGDNEDDKGNANDSEGDDDAQISSESDTEDARRDIKRGEKDTLQQVEALLRTFDAKQSMSSSLEHQSAAMKLKHQRSAGRHGSLQLMPVFEGAADVHEPQQQQHAGETAVVGFGTVDRAARLDAVHAFFREKRRQERQEQQKQREVLALLAEASYNASNQGFASGGSGSSQGAKAGEPVRGKISASMMARKRSNGVVSFALNSVLEQAQAQAQTNGSQASFTVSTFQQQQQAQTSAALSRRQPVRPPKTAR